jgi:hypothetical protein
MLKNLAQSLALSLAAVFMTLAVGCAQLSVPHPKNSEEQAVLVLAAVAGVRDATATLLTAGKISIADAENVQRQADNVHSGVVIARSLISFDPAAADAKLKQTQMVLGALQVYLATKEKKQ